MSDGAESAGTNAPGSSDPGGAEGGSAAAPPQGTPTATGVLLAHAAGFPSFRLCFEKFPELAPQPDSNVMPEANVVGVEVGSLVRIDPLKEPGQIYVIAESEVRSTPGKTDFVPCGELIRPPDKKTNRSLTLDIDYHVATVIDRPLGENKVSVLAITGCGGQAFLNSLGLSSASCGAGWDATSGNLEAKVVDLNTTVEGATEESLPVQLFQMSRAIDVFKGSGSLDVRFGDLSDGGAPSQPVEIGAIFEGGKQAALTIDQRQAAIYGSWGFRVSAVTPNGTFSNDQSLAAVQELSSPREVPTTYYRTASNYALLLLGDPTHEPRFEDGGKNPLYNPRQAVHLLAVPVLDPSKADAGADAASFDDAGDGGP
jgi:hypothetical protein